MPLMKGRAPIRRTIRYLERGLTFSKDFKVMMINWNDKQKASAGLYEFAFWHVPQLKYRNPSMEILTFRNFTPTPWIQFINNNGDKITVDCYGQNKDDILKHLKNTFCNRTVIEANEGILIQRQKTQTATTFGEKQFRHCICKVPGQVPCPGWSLLPIELRGCYNPPHLKNKEQTNETDT